MIPSREFRMAGMILFAMALVHPATAQAYVGPGAGLTAIGTVVALIAALLLAVVGFVWYPVKRFRQKRKASPHPTDSTQEGQ